MGRDRLTIGLGHSLGLILLLDGEGVGGLSGSVDDLVGKALSNGLHVSERSLSSAHNHQVEGLVHAAERRDIDSLSSENASSADTGRVLARARVNDSIDQDLNGVLIGEEVDQLEGVLDDADSHQLLAVVAAVSHHEADESLDDGALDR